MKKSQKIKDLSTRKERTHYSGKFSNFQEFGSSYKGKRYSQYEKDPYNEYQNFLYKRALFGLKMYTAEELKDMHWQKKKRIKKVHKRTQYELNLWKQEKTIAITNMVIGLFNNSSLAEEIQTEHSQPDPKFISTLSFKDLGIEKKEIINRLIHKGILSADFNKKNEKETKSL